MKILAISGGGILGYIAALYLHKLETHLSKPLYKEFDLICGVSTGAILGYSIASDIDPRDVVNLYLTRAEKIFKDKRGFFRSLFRPYYDIENLEQVLIHELDFDKIKDTDTNFMTYAVNVSDPLVKTDFWKSWRPSGDEVAAKAITASCAAPVYFSPYQLDGKVYLDGALSTNNPAMAGIAEAIKLGAKIEDIKVLNIGFRTIPSPRNPVKDLTGLLSVVTRLTDINMFAIEKMEAHQARVMLGTDRYKYITPDASLPIDSLDFTTMGMYAENLWYETYHGVLKMLRE